MKPITRTVLTVLITATMTLLLFGGNRTPAPTVQAQASNTRASWITNERASANQLNAWALNQIGLDAEYRAGGYSSALVTGDFTGANVGLTVSDMTTAEGNLTSIANAVLQSPGTSFPVTISTGTATTIYKIK